MSTPLNGVPTTVGVFAEIQKAYIARAFLESRGIHCFIKDDNGRNYTYNRLYGLDFTELQVGNLDSMKARTLLIEYDYVSEDVIAPSRMMIALDKFTAGMPLMEGWSFEGRLTVLLIALLILLAGFATLIFKNTLL